MNLSTDSKLKIAMHDDPYLPTDAMAFYLNENPSISFFTGSHSEYHTHKDRAELLNYQGIELVSKWIADLATTLASSPKALVKYQKVEGQKRFGPGEGGRGFRLYLGTIPDYAQEGKDGVKISGTTKGSPAEVAGLKAGDVITSLGGIQIKTLQDYVYCLQALKANEKTKIGILREGSAKLLDITPVSKN